jgi:NADH dehydrogenase/NADH:ubiquinone oxidoreductase subunit G
MSEVSLKIDGKEVRIEEGKVVLDAARKAGVYIPTLCHDDRLEAYGACRVCTVEVEMRGRTSLVASCCYPVEPGLIVRTRSERVDRIRKTLVELLLARAPDAPALLDLAREYGADKDRFERVPSFCILCGLCVRYCAEVKKANAIGFVERGVKREVAFVPEIASKECWNCRECFSLCPTEYLQATFVLTEALSSFSSPSEPAPE